MDNALFNLEYRLKREISNGHCVNYLWLECPSSVKNKMRGREQGLEVALAMVKHYQTMEAKDD